MYCKNDSESWTKDLFDESFYMPSICEPKETFGSSCRRFMLLTFRSYPPNTQYSFIKTDPQLNISSRRSSSSKSKLLRHDNLAMSPSNITKNQQLLFHITIEIYKSWRYQSEYQYSSLTMASHSIGNTCVFIRITSIFYASKFIVFAFAFFLTISRQTFPPIRITDLIWKLTILPFEVWQLSLWRDGLFIRNGRDRGPPKNFVRLISTDYIQLIP